MKAVLLIPALLLSACATTPAGLLATDVEATLVSSKSPQAFATCVAENLAGDVELRSDGERYWVLWSDFDIPRLRWDFTPTETGSIAEMRASGLSGGMVHQSVRDCA